MLKKAIFLDRDGVINRDIGYLGSWNNFEFLPGAQSAMRALCEAGYSIIIVTNQSGIARGYYSIDDYERLTTEMIGSLSECGVSVLAVYYCPHHPTGSVERFAVNCDCRKPAPGMILRAAAEHGIDLASSVFIGDKHTDMQAAASAGVGRAYLVGVSDPLPPERFFIVDGRYGSLSECVDRNRAFTL